MDSLPRALVLSIIVVAVSQSTLAGIMLVDTLNIIDDAGNPSHGLRFLDASYGLNKTLADALTAARAVYANARRATIQEHKDLFFATGASYSVGGKTIADGWETAGTITISSGANYNTALRTALGTTAPGFTRLFTDPDGAGGYQRLFFILDFIACSF